MTYDNQKELLAITQKVFELMKYFQSLEVTVGEMNITLHNIRIGAAKAEVENV